MNYFNDVQGVKSYINKTLPRVGGSQHKQSAIAKSDTNNKHEDAVPKFKTKDLLMM